MHIERVNEIMLGELAQAVNSELGLPGALITISFVECDPDLKTARVGVSVLPDNLAGTTLRLLKSSTPHLVSLLKSRIRLRRIPKLIWEFDPTEREAEKIEKLIEEME